VKKVLIIYPHFPPSNLVGVHRPRLFAQHLPSFGWEPVILTVHEKFYEEKHDHNLVKLLPPNLRIEKVGAFPIGKRRIIGDIGLRAFFQLYKRAKQLIKEEHFDVLVISIASFYCALLGRMLHYKTGIKYGIDYQDPWVHDFPGSDKAFSRHWFSSKLANFLEPIAVKNASLITGVSESYYLPVLERNRHLKKVVSGAMPMGGEKMDHEIVASLNITPYLFTSKTNKVQFVYAGAMLPKAYKPLESILKAIRTNIEDYKNIEFHFIGTGSKPNDVNGYNIKPLAEKYGLWNTIIFEYPARIPYLDVLVHLNIADAVFILGSTEPHYTPSKVYQAILCKKPILAVLHKESSAVNVIGSSKAGCVLSFNGVEDLASIEGDFQNSFLVFCNFLKSFNINQVNDTVFSEYSAFAVTQKFANLLDKIN
jgi:glycosyltransferase involved in cell wall biosynthesis